uniref:protein-tyrosine-phosphatase n=1 Tax=Anopheles melas TaxID=34690 RepID=A0A182TT18_9DIPT
MYYDDNVVFEIVEHTSGEDDHSTKDGFALYTQDVAPRRFTLNSAGRSPASRRTEQRQRSLQFRQHGVPQRMIYDDGCKMLGSPGKENMPTEELSFYQSHSPQQSPRPCSPCTLCPEDGELLPSESNTPSKHMAIPIVSGTTGPMVVAAAAGKLTTGPGGLGYRLRRPLDDHDPNSMDSGYGASVLNDALMSSLHNSSSGSVTAAKQSHHSLFQFNQSQTAQSTSLSRHNSASSPANSRGRLLLHSSLSSGSMESMDDMELFDMEAMEDDDMEGKGQPGQQSRTQQPSGLSSLICGTIKTTTRTATTPEHQKRPFVRRCLSLTENNNGTVLQQQQQMKTPERYSRRMIAIEDQENCNLTPYSSRTEAAVTRCFKRPEPPGISPVQSKRSKMQMDVAAFAPPAVTALDSPARTTVLAAVPKKPVYQKSISMNDAQIMSALSRSSSEPDLIGDFSKSYVLPLMEGQHRDLKSISGDTMARLVRGDYNDKIASFKIIDCRYPYEYEGGHIRGAKNLYTQEQIVEELIQSKTVPPKVTDGQDGTMRRHIIVFHCEFSSERGPKLSRFLRNHDRILNADSYPALHYPEMYLLHGGYKEFFKAHAELCDPIAYRPMLDPDFGEAYRHFRAKSRSWNGDGTGTVKASATASSSSLAGGPNRLTKSRSRLML